VIRDPSLVNATFFRVSLRVCDDEDARASDLRLYVWRDRKDYRFYLPRFSHDMSD
jgi:hypothetical protein